MGLTINRPQKTGNKMDPMIETIDEIKNESDGETTDETGDAIPSYPKLKAPTHKDVQDLFEGEIVVEIKIDGSNVSFRKDPVTGNMVFRSRTIMLDPEHINLDRTFTPFIKTINSMSERFDPKYIYRGEYLKDPKHVKITYNRVPLHHVVLFDIQDAVTGQYLGVDLLLKEAERIGFEVVPIIFRGTLPKDESFIMEKATRLKFLNDILEKGTKCETIAGSKANFMGDIIEGIVIKNYEKKSTRGGDPLLAKLVREEHKELSKRKKGGRYDHNRPGITSEIGNMYANENRFLKAYQRLKESNVTFLDTTEDIPRIVGEIHRDVLDEELPNITNMLWKDAKHKYSQKLFNDPEKLESVKTELWLKNKNAILKKITATTGTWYKREILKM